MLFTFLFLILSCGGNPAEKPDLTRDRPSSSKSDGINRSSSGKKSGKKLEPVNVDETTNIKPSINPKNNKEYIILNYDRRNFESDFINYAYKIKDAEPVQTVEIEDYIKRNSEKVALSFLKAKSEQSEKQEQLEKDEIKNIPTLVFCYLMSLEIFNLDLFQKLIDEYGALINSKIDTGYSNKLLTQKLAELAYNNNEVDDFITFAIYNGASIIRLINEELYSFRADQQTNHRMFGALAREKDLFSKLIELVDWEGDKDRLDGKNLLEIIFNPSICYVEFVIETMKKSPKWETWDKNMKVKVVLYKSETETEEKELPLIFNTVSLFANDNSCLEFYQKDAIFTFKTLKEATNASFSTTDYAEHFFQSNPDISHSMCHSYDDYRLSILPKMFCQESGYAYGSMEKNDVRSMALRYRKQYSTVK